MFVRVRRRLRRCLAMFSDLRRRSSMAEHLFCKQVVAGSTPVAGSILSDSLGLVMDQTQTEPRFTLPDGVMVAQQILNLFV